MKVSNLEKSFSWLFASSASESVSLLNVHCTLYSTHWKALQLMIIYIQAIELLQFYAHDDNWGKNAAQLFDLPF